MYTINLIEYYFQVAVTWIAQYVMYLYNTFMDFSPIIKIAAISLTFSCGLIIYTLFKILINGIRNRRWKKRYNKLDKKYGEGIRYILSPEAGGNLSRQQIIEALKLDDPENKNKNNLLKGHKEKLTFARLVYKCRISDDASLGRRKNLHILLNIFQIPPFLEDIVNKASLKRKAEALTMLRAFKLPVNQWIANTLRNSKRYRVRRLAMYASIMTSSNTDLEYFESDFFDQNCCIYDEIQLGYVLQRRIAMKRRLPNLAQLAASQKNPGTQTVFVKLMRQFDQAEYCPDLEELFNTSGDKELTQEICRTWGYLKYKEGEEMMQDIILTQPDDTKVAIMHALTRLGTGKSLGILVDGYKNSGDQYVKYESLRCLYNYGAVGLAKFKELALQAKPEEKRLFEFFNNPITRRETKLSREDIYEEQGESLFSVV